MENGLSANGTRMGVVLFSNWASIPIKFNDYYNVDEFRDGVRLLPQEGSVTRMDRGFKIAYDKLFTRGYGSRYALRNTKYDLKLSTPSHNRAHYIWRSIILLSAIEASN